MKPRPAEPVVLSAFGRIISIHELSHFLEICCCTAAHVEFEYQDVCFDDGYYAWFEGSDSLEDMNLCVTGVGYKYNIYSIYDDTSSPAGDSYLAFPGFEVPSLPSGETWCRRWQQKTRQKQSKTHAVRCHMVSLVSHLKVVCFLGAVAGPLLRVLRPDPAQARSILTFCCIYRGAYQPKARPF